MTHKVTATWTHPDSDQTYTVEATIYPGAPGVRHGFDRFAEPDEPDEITIESIESEVQTFGENQFSDWEIEQIKESCFEQAENEMI